MNRYKYLLHGIVVMLIPLSLFAAEQTRRSFYETVSNALSDGDVMEILEKNRTYVVTPFTLEQDGELRCTQVTRSLANTIELVLTANKIPVYPLLAQERTSLEDKCDQSLPKNLVLPPTVSSFITGTLRSMDEHTGLILRITDLEGREKHRSMLRLDQLPEFEQSMDKAPENPMASTSGVKQDAQSELTALQKKVQALINSADKTLLASKAVRYLQEAEALIEDNAGFDAELQEIQEKLSKHQETLEYLQSDDYDF